MICKYVLMLFIATTVCYVEASVFSWFWGRSSDESSALVADGIPLVSIPYEAMTEDEKFLQEASKLTDIQISSPLETCQHKVIMKIKTSCSGMTEEQLAKLSVNLLNCQSAVEGRKMYPCTEHMSLKQCTTDMDADMWNAYHLMSNRARAVCYASRSTQFRALTELTVNKLMHTAHTQIKTLSSLKESQDRLEESTLEALSSLSKGNEALLLQQQNLKDAQASAYKLVTTNLKDLTNERALIRTGHTQLAAMAEDIRNKLEKANQDIMEQATERGENHREILEDLMSIQEQANLIWDKIESSTNRIFEQHEQAIDHYEQTLQKLAQINETIQFIWDLTNAMRKEVDEKLGWITEYIGDTGEQIQRVYRTTLHIVYLFVAMIVASFLQAPFLTRATIMGIVPLNLISYLKHGTEACLDFTAITTLIFLITAMHFIMVGIQYIFAPKKAKITQPHNTVNQNGYSNGNAYKHTSPSCSNSTPGVSLYTRVVRSIHEMYKNTYHLIYRCAEKLNTLIQSVASWSRQSIMAREELSCSYIPSKRMREDLIHDYEKEFPSMSEDNTDMEISNIMNEKYDNFSDLDSLVDAVELRRRLRRGNGSVLSSYSTPRSVTPHKSPKITCNALTRNGTKCRCFVTQGSTYCIRHINGSSIMGD